MKVTIDSVTQVATEIFVSFSSEFGFAIANWVGLLPKVGEIYDVELDPAGSVIWGGLRILHQLISTRLVWWMVL